MKRLMVLMLVVIFALSAAVSAAPGKAPAKAKVSIKAIRMADEKAIKSVVLKAAHFTGLYKYDGGVAKTKPKFDLVKIADGWASAHYDQTSTVRGLEEIPSEVSYLLKKSSGKWRAVYEFQGGMMLKELEKVGLSPATARRLDIAVSNATDGDEGRLLR